MSKVVFKRQCRKRLLRIAGNDIVGIINSSGTQVVAYSYDTWGKLISVTGSLASTIGEQNPFRYRGYYYDNETGFYYLQSRYYDPTTGRFISPDVLVSTGQGIIGHNMYAYCGNNPVSRLDTTGAFFNTILGAFVGAVAGAVTAAITGGDIGTGALSGAVGGAIAGAALDIAIATGGVGAIAIVAVGGAISGVVEERISNKNATATDYIVSGVVGAGFNMLTFGFYDLARPAAKSIKEGLIRCTVEPIKELIKMTPKKLVKNLTFDFCYDTLTSGFATIFGTTFKQIFSET